MRTRTILLCVLLLTVPLAAPLAPAPARAQGPCGPVYTVVEGDTLFSIARRCGLTVGQILAANPGLPSPNRILVGQQLFLPAGGPIITPPVGGVPSFYVVREGDTLFRIAQRFGTTVEALLAANPGISDPNRIQAGQVLLIPDPRFPPPTRTPTPAVGPTVTLSPSNGQPGTVVQVLGSGFPAGAAVDVLLGPDLGRLSVVATAVADFAGRVSAVVAIPMTARPPERWPVVLSATAPVTAVGLAQFTVLGPPFPPTVTPTVTPTPTVAPGVEIRVQLFAIALGAGNLGCGDAVVPAVTRDIAPTRAPLTATLEELLALGSSIPERPDLYNALDQSDLQVEGIDLVGDTAIVRLVGAFQIGGVCDEPRVRAQVESTVLQFSAVRQTVIFVNGVRLEDLLGGQG